MNRLDVTKCLQTVNGYNLLGSADLNAIKYQSPKRPLRLTFTAKKKSHHVSLLIQDNGSGIAEQDIGRVFEQGFTGETSVILPKSTGMGLFICKNCAENWGFPATGFCFGTRYRCYHYVSGW